jgi:hypothetical protein
MACTFPQAEELGQFWYNLVNGIDALAPPARQASGMPTPGPLRAAAQQGDEAAYMWIRHTIRQALHDAGLSLEAALQCPVQLVVGQQTSEAGRTPAVRMAQELGPQVTVDAVDAAAMQALHVLVRGVRALRAGHCDILVLATAQVLDQAASQIDAAAVVLKRQADAAAARLYRCRRHARAHRAAGDARVQPGASREPPA